MRAFIEYWIAVLALTKSQAFSAFFKLVKLSAPRDRDLEFRELTKRTVEESKEILKELE